VTHATEVCMYTVCTFVPVVVDRHTWRSNGTSFPFTALCFECDTQVYNKTTVAHLCFSLKPLKICPQMHKDNTSHTSQRSSSNTYSLLNTIIVEWDKLICYILEASKDSVEDSKYAFCK